MLRQSLRVVSRRNTPYVCVSCKVLGASPARPARYYSVAVETSTSMHSHADVGVHATGSGKEAKEAMVNTDNVMVRKVKSHKNKVRGRKSVLSAL